MEEFTYELKAPKERVAVLIGKKGEVKRYIEEQTNCKLNIDSKEGDVIVSGKDGISLFTAKEIIRAISRGFVPEKAFLLLNQDYQLEVIDISDYAKNLDRVKARIIGTGGKARKTMEDLTGCYISVYGKTISVLGEIEDLFNTAEAVKELVRGAPHRNVYSKLEKMKRRRKVEKIIL